MSLMIGSTYWDSRSTHALADLVVQVAGHALTAIPSSLKPKEQPRYLQMRSDWMVLDLYQIRSEDRAAVSACRAWWSLSKMLATSDGLSGCKRLAFLHCMPDGVLIHDHVMLGY